MEPRLFITLLVLFASHVLAKPAIDQDPIKISLNAGDDKARPSFDVTSRIQNGMEWFERMMDAIRFGRGRFVNSVAIARNIIAERVEELMSETRNNVAGAIGAANDIIEKSRSVSYERAPFAQFLPPKTRETARLENEKDQSILERRIPANPLAGILERLVKPTPIVDGLKEEEKYGNSGDRFIGLSRALVGGFEGIGNFLDKLTSLPLSSVKQASRTITEGLNQIGGKLTGLQ